MYSPILLAALAACATLASAGQGRFRLFGIPKDEEGATAPTAMNNATFPQLIDHKNPDLGTFSQFYYYSDEWWGGPGSPVILLNNGESAETTTATAYLKNTSLTGAFAQEVHGAIVIIEHRYWGQSSPFDELTRENLKYLTLENSIADMTYFAQNVQLPFDKNGSSNALHAPWVLSGGSYSGALAAWTASTSPGTFWAYHASSAPVQAISDFWSYSLPIQEGMPQNCSKDISRVIDYIDTVLENGTPANKTTLKSLFGLQKLSYDDDFAAALFTPFGAWQNIGYASGYSPFYRFCDAIESGGTFNFSTPTSNSSSTGNSSLSLPPASGVGLSTALAGYAWYFQSELHLPADGSGDVTQFDSHDATNPKYTDLSVTNPYDRQWVWLLCNEPFNFFFNFWETS